MSTTPIKTPVSTPSLVQSQQPPPPPPPPENSQLSYGAQPGAVIAGGAPRNDAGPCGKILYILGFIGAITLYVLTLPVALFMSFKLVQQYERAVIFRLGRIQAGEAKGPGTFFILPCLDDYRCIDLRTKTYDVPPQVVLTRDSVSITVDAVIYYRVFNPVTAVANVINYDHSTRLLSATILRNVLGMKNLQQVLSEREDIAAIMQHSLDEATDPWGVKVERVEVKDVRLPVQLQRAMAAEAEAARDAKAKVIAAEGEVNSSKALKEASDMMAGSPGALQLRYLQTLTQIATERNSTILFPLPIEILKAFNR